MVRQAKLRAVLVGGVGPLAGAPVESGIDKRIVSGPRRVEALGLQGDAQADLRVHGGVDKAVHAYPWEHYDCWRTLFPDNLLFQAHGGFGENLSLEGLDERGICIADRWRAGSVLLEVSQGRQPCWKLNLRFGIADMASRVQQALRTGWYFRVITPGELAAGDTLELVERPFPSHSVAEILALIRDGAIDARRLRPVLELPLTTSWRKLLEKRLSEGRVEDWSARLTGVRS
jgi:MOSC domain-containing protein YiiM